MTFGPKDCALYEALISKTRIISTSIWGGRALPLFAPSGAFRRLIGLQERVVNQASRGF